MMKINMIFISIVILMTLGSCTNRDVDNYYQKYKDTTSYKLPSYSDHLKFQERFKYFFNIEGEEEYNADFILKIIQENNSSWFMFYLDSHMLFDRISFEFGFHFPQYYCNDFKTESICDFILEYYNSFGIDPVIQPKLLNKVLEDFESQDLGLRFLNWQIVYLIRNNLNESACDIMY